MVGGADAQDPIGRAILEWCCCTVNAITHMVVTHFEEPDNNPRWDFNIYVAGPMVPYVLVRVEENLSFENNFQWKPENIYNSR
jgi:hypothetical protein